MKEQLKSVHNQHVKNWKKLATKKFRRQSQRYLLDGWHLVAEALQNGAKVVQLIGTPDELAQHSDIVSRVEEVYEVTPEIIKHITETVSPQGICAVAEIPATYGMPSQLTGAWLMLDSVQDPGNVGTMVRTADAAGFAGVVVNEKTADLFSPKVVRSMQGSQFHLHLYNGDLKKWLAAFQRMGAPVYGTELNPAAQNCRKVKTPATFALIMGNEGNGMDRDLLALTDHNLYIPMRGRAESLNVAVSAGILMFQLNQSLQQDD
ncbi:TrmH family RNA methyltransferase [Limosilactobacillus difficilis]|uniref:TrmH family RNA methyltransferase n=1 Tax=Limosilactobacillus difficilis TaxID=2991838 RepID=UPI0024BB6708|nr:RNA methyltransferase [Limosilactobacillus difficilis]